MNATDHFVLSLEDNGVEWKSLLEEKLNKNFNWAETFKAALGKGEEDALEQVKIALHTIFSLTLRSCDPIQMNGKIDNL